MRRCAKLGKDGAQGTYGQLRPRASTKGCTRTAPKIFDEFADDLMTDLAGPAVFSSCGRYRYRTRPAVAHRERAVRVLHAQPLDGGRHAGRSDGAAVHTIRYRLGLRGLDRAQRLRATGDGPDGATPGSRSVRAGDNEAVCREALGSVDRVIVAWGNVGAYRFHHLAALAWIADAGLTPYCLGVTESGQPRHPLYCRANITPEEYAYRSLLGTDGGSGAVI